MEVINAVELVCHMIPAWRVDRKYLEMMYDTDVKPFGGDVRTQIERLGDIMCVKYLRRYVESYHGTRLDLAFFRGSNVDDFIRLISWPDSAKRGVLVDMRGGRLL